MRLALRFLFILGTANGAEILQPSQFSAFGFMHVFKAGGSTYGAALAKYARAHHMPFFTDMREGGPSEIPAYLRALNPRTKHLAVDAPPPQSNFSIFHGHLVDMGFGKLNHHHSGSFNQFFPAAGRASAPLLAVALREPAARLMSAFMQLTAGLEHKPGASLSMDPQSLQGGVMDKGNMEAMFAEFMKQQGVAQCRVVPNQVFGPRFAAPCAEGDLDPSKLAAMSDLLRQYILPLITERLEESAALLDVFLGLQTPPSMLQLVRHGLPIRCGSYERWRLGRRHGMLEECQDNPRGGKGSGANQAGPLVTSTVRRVVDKAMGYELWLYQNATALFNTHLKLLGIHTGRPQEFSCKPKTLQGCTRKEAKFMSRWQSTSRGELSAEIRRLTSSMGNSPASDIKAMKKLAVLETLLHDAQEPEAREEL
ncbi:unnamed protein product [Symbiodinium natans]|uniref:Sulfotransferase domain-containing protein n=1 Tax=Symbiodinium natans TaxID=878477 RepID=A0A812IMQ6_9DINO|nr:unnamed protein product [Symbiodinium natans]